MKQFADRHRTDRAFAEGNWVYLKLQAYRQTTVAVRKNLKLAAKYYGPYQIEKRVGAVAYKLKLPSGAAIHPVFHVSLLKPSTKGAPASTILPQPSEEGSFAIIPSSILDRRWIDRGGHKVEQILVQWKDDATWEDLSVIRSQFPDFNPRD
ncbi:uncharacterized protein [Coffea arabica]|uniref:Tf2-1-like SH3-like domain-containing protein n=1 Tax=Coffea arabica TaxID=13443 RepID=A0ABM4UY97_COFAR